MTKVEKYIKIYYTYKRNRKKVFCESYICDYDYIRYCVIRSDKNKKGFY